jgi:sugar lactone lactonase YvrE
MRLASALISLTASLFNVLGQEYLIGSIAGGSPPPTPAQGTTTSIGPVGGIAKDNSGNIYFSSTDLNCVFKIDRDGLLTRFAGNSRPGYSGDGGPATSAQLYGPRSLAVDGSGNVYIADVSNRRLRRVSVSGVITTVVTDSTASGIAVDNVGNVYIAEQSRNQVRRLSTSGTLTTVAGTGMRGYSGDGGPATAAELFFPQGLAVDMSGNLYIADFDNYRVRRVSSDGLITTVAGTGPRNGILDDSGDGGPATAAQLGDGPFSLAFDRSNNLYIGGFNSPLVRRVSPDGIITTVAGSRVQGSSGDGGPATTAALICPCHVVADDSGSLYIGTSGNDNRVRRVDPSGVITTFAGNRNRFYWGDGDAATSAGFYATTVAVDNPGNLYIVDYFENRVRRVSTDGIITTVAGNGTEGNSGDGGPAILAGLPRPEDIALDSNGNLYIASGNTVRRVSPSGLIARFAGNGFSGYSGDGEPATSARLNGPRGLALDSLGNLYISDTGNHRVRRVSPTGVITTIAGDGTSGSSGDGGAATAAQLNSPRGLAVDSAGGLYISDSSSRVRYVSVAGIITTAAGSGVPGESGDGGLATEARVSPNRIDVDSGGNLYISTSNRVRRVSSNGVITTIAGDGISAYNGDGGPATAAQLASSFDIAVGGAGRVYVATGNAVRILTPLTTICTVSVMPTMLTALVAGGALTLNIQTAAGCAWTIAGLPDWITASRSSGSGPLAITLAVAANSGRTRSVTISVSGTSISINQQGTSVCAYSLSHGGEAFSSAGGNGSVSVSAASDCVWTVVNPLSWVTISGANSGTGNGNVLYHVATNSGSARSGTLTIAGRGFAVEQGSASTSSLNNSGSIAQVASGGYWKTTIALVNTGAAPAQVRLSFVGGNGSPLILPLAFPQGSDSLAGPMIGSTLDRTVNAGALLVIETSGLDTSPTQVGWMQLLSNGTISCSAVLQQRIGSSQHEALVSLENRNARSYLLYFDNTSGYMTGIALASVGGGNQGAPVSITIRDDSGTVLLTSTITLSAQGHTTFNLADRYPPTLQKRGTIEFGTPTNGQLSVLGLRFNPTGAFSTIPVSTK